MIERSHPMERCVTAEHQPTSWGGQGEPLGLRGPPVPILLHVVELAVGLGVRLTVAPEAYTMRITLWAAMIVGTALWGYGLFVTGTPSLIDWKSNAPWWIADYLPNMESELGLVLVCLGSLAPYWPRQRQGPPR